MEVLGAVAVAVAASPGDSTCFSAISTYAEITFAATPADHTVVVIEGDFENDEAENRTQFIVHKYVLASQSKHFYNLFFGSGRNFLEEKVTEFREFPGGTSTFEMVLKLMYGFPQDSVVTDSSLVHVHAGAKVLACEELLKKLNERLCSMLQSSTFENLFVFLKQAIQINDVEVSNRILTQSSEHFVKQCFQESKYWIFPLKHFRVMIGLTYEEMVSFIQKVLKQVVSTSSSSSSSSNSSSESRAYFGNVRTTEVPVSGTVSYSVVDLLAVCVGSYIADYKAVCDPDRLRWASLWRQLPLELLSLAAIQRLETSEFFAPKALLLNAVIQKAKQLESRCQNLVLENQMYKSYTPDSFELLRARQRRYFRHRQAFERDPMRYPEGGPRGYPPPHFGDHRPRWLPHHIAIGGGGMAEELPMADEDWEEMQQYQAGIGDGPRLLVPSHVAASLAREEIERAGPLVPERLRTYAHSSNTRSNAGNATALANINSENSASRTRRVSSL